MTDEEALEYMPRVRELVDVVRDRDGAAVEACLAYTPPATLAVLVAEQAGEWESELLELHDRCSEWESEVQMLRDRCRLLEAHLARARAEVSDLRQRRKELQATVARQAALLPKSRKAA